jgi:hypothetical protein
VAIELTDDLIALERTAWTAHLELRRIQAEYGKGDWTPEQHAAWDAQWKAWGEAADAFQEAVTAHAEATGQSRYEVEMAAKKAVRHPEG